MIEVHDEPSVGLPGSMGLVRKMKRRISKPEAGLDFRPGAGVGWRAALLEIEHQAQHWDAPAHGAVGHLIAEALRAAVEIARTGGLCCDHRLEPDPEPWGDEAGGTVERAAQNGRAQTGSTARSA
jgi:hypothetical protein